ncbi:phenoloxidase-activating factor 1-like isoform X2 [Pectinophora gossypiella]|uniref:phenoloxidase-activating factor 1-like isoform X2 n=1 Tax=Pectinophora gossypiella TaxID=13191 RepID=UPI00214F248C|nr:phenoloxidase-activating factor 1-like isoform X2 [Pectinophora gossypiella]
MFPTTKLVSVLFVILKSDDVTGTLWSDVANHSAWKMLDFFECGENAADRIIGGLDAALGQFPWIARLGYVSEDNETDWMCGGALISDRHIVTAAHCVRISPDEEFQLSFVRLGEYDTRTDPDCKLRVCAPPVQDRAVKPNLVRSHKLFNNPNFHNDIAIIELDTPVELNNYVSPICLPKEDQLGDLKVGELVTVAGWGKMNMSTDQRADVLQYVQLPVVQPVVCDSIGRGFTVSESEICAGAQLNKDACGGDSGGPMMKIYDTPDGPKTYLVGTVSFGPTICGIKKPGVYASISHYLHWILDNIL